MNIFATILLATTVSTNATMIRTAEELHALPNEVLAKGVKFNLTGTVSFVPNQQVFFLVDDTGGACVRHYKEAIMRQGDIVQVLGVAIHNRNKELTLFGSEIIRIGKTKPLENIEATAEQIMRGDCDWRPLRIKGIVRDAFKDEIDPHWIYLVLNCNTHLIYAAFQGNDISESTFIELIDAVVSVKGACRPMNSGVRLFLGRHIEMSGYSDITVLEKAPNDPFNAPLLHEIRSAQPHAVFGMRRHRTVGAVIAVWGGDRFLIETANGELVRVEIASGGKLPSYGDGVEVVGFPETDLYRVNLSRAMFRPAKATVKQQTPQLVSPTEILKSPDGMTKIKTEYHGRTVRLRGFARSLPPPESDNGRMSIECDGYLVPVDASSCRESLNGIMVGAELEITGACILNTENWHPPAPFPRIDGFMLVVRKRGDVKMLSRPPWWTPARLLVIIGVLLAALGGIAVWNRTLNRVVERRSRELMKERFAHDGADLKVEERTRLAVELHDTLAQNLTGISLQIDAAEMAAEENPNSVMTYLKSARRKMQNCRENLRNCLWDLRSRAFEEKELAEAIRKTIAPHIGKADVLVDMDVPCRKLSDNAIHAALCIARELVINAIRHGKATRIMISGQLENAGLSFSVSDNGIGFDPATRPGLSEGHFGLQGVLERAHRLGGTFEITSKPNQGATAILSHLSPEP